MPSQPKPPTAPAKTDESTSAAHKLQPVGRTGLTRPRNRLPGRARD
jgi:hypothetical protein